MEIQPASIVANAPTRSGKLSSIMPSTVARVTGKVKVHDRVAVPDFPVDLKAGIGLKISFRGFKERREPIMIRHRIQNP
jgi:hypothetical protein